MAELDQFANDLRPALEIDSRDARLDALLPKIAELHPHRRRREIPDLHAERLQFADVAQAAVGGGDHDGAALELIGVHFRQVLFDDRTQQAVEDHAHRTVPHFRGEPARSCHGAILSRNGASRIPGAVQRLSTNWRAINGRNQLSLLLAGEHFADGRLQRQPTPEGAAA